MRSIRLRMSFYFTLSILVMLAIFDAGWYSYSRHVALRDADIRLKSAIARITSEPMIKWNSSNPIGTELDEELRDLKLENLGVLVLDRSGSVVASTGGANWFSKKDRKPDSNLEFPWRIKTSPAGKNGYTLLVGMNWSEQQQGIDRLAQLLIVVSLLVIIVCAIGSWALVGKTLSPIGQLAIQAKEASTDKLTIQLTSPSNDDEVVKLVDTLNQMLAGFSETTAIRGRFYAAAAHELRTPIQALSGHLELALHRLPEGSIGRDGVGEALSQTRRLIELIQDLLLLNQLELSNDRQETIASDTASVSDCCDLTLAELSGAITSRGLSLSKDLDIDIRLIAPVNHLRILVRNLVENAVKYAIPNGQIEVKTLAAYDGKRDPTLSVFNSSVPMPPSEMARLTEPFYRSEVSLNSVTPGNGLGLSICKGICNANGWELILESVADGMRVSVVFHQHKDSPICA